MLIRGEDVTIPTSMVGNYPNPRWWDAQFARTWTGDQEPPDALIQESLEDAVAAIARDQERAGLDIISDGRVHGDNYAEQALYYYYRRLGYDLKGGYLGFPIYSRLHAGTLTGEVRRHGAIMVEQAKALKKATGKPTKVQYTGVQALTQATNDLHYKSSRDRAMAIAKAINEDIREVDALGVDFIQIDEFTWPYFFEDWAIEAFNAAVDGVKNAKIIAHVCWGNWGGTPAYYPDETAASGEIFDLTKRKAEATKATATGSIVPKAYEARLDVLNLESCGRRSDDLSGLHVMKNHPLPDNVSFWAGVIDVKSTITETADEVANRIRRLLEIVPADRLGVTTDCGLILLQRYIAQDKLHALVEGTKIVRAELAKAKQAA
ncbi:2-hydroxypropyl-CoM lyase (plasmid) [Xanthobacter versatilis]|uniref:2-hydroxypropyl-CoM lyase n=1 Tax=Xanthobacter autotrophicus (strain ATCC BAA-1158 / Py2) TaxID=78245 RepID=XECA_XANP2|nr:RecName: Full=2-hydroxypropyl-CoM lyase; AltName: Full=Aliphatic epoxide carboxylation component I; AltName: Full=Epoxide carboxylase component I; AltName: Full=Epoxyalkane:CoM transferase; Short=EaCoMT [Xanthobacter autotrophicus Py2]ABS70076.1 2-hydroxypropyl-CoM lyase [Xanthobacter autotrophicus Py2]ABS70245.1 2-hydroxypropyl-CoM lyase [Xanthobacter autotrophicus Py2]CAA56241.1 orf1 [Xanthobacter autotrophicus Py2]